jgi:hypothetical protein
MDWLSIAKALPFEGKRKVKHCGSDRTMLVTHGRVGFSAHCFRCGPVGFKKHGPLSIAQLLERRKANDELQTGGVSLPADFTLEIPAQARLWLQKAGVTAETAAFYGIGYSKRTHRVIIQIWEAGVMVAVLARAVDGSKPKYIAHMRGTNEYFTSATEPTEAATVVVTEDVLSAIRCGAVYRSVAILGTGASSAAVAGLSARLADASGATIAVWLDPDRAGRVASRRIVRALRLAGWDAYAVRSERDPKYYSNAEIKEIVLGAGHHASPGDEGA